MKKASISVLGILAIVFAISSAFTSKNVVRNGYAIFSASTDAVLSPASYSDAPDFWTNENGDLSILTDGATTFEDLMSPQSFDALYPDEQSLETFEEHFCDFDTDGKVCVIQLQFISDVVQDPVVDYVIGDRK